MVKTLVIIKNVTNPATFIKRGILVFNGIKYNDGTFKVRKNI